MNRSEVVGLGEDLTFESLYLAVEGFYAVEGLYLAVERTGQVVGLHLWGDEGDIGRSSILITVMT